MKIAIKHHAIEQILVPIICLFLLPKFINLVGAQSWEAPPPPSNINLPARFSPAMAIILFILVGGFLFMAFYSIYIRNCTNRSNNNNNNNAPRARSRRALGRGLEASVIETFPIFSYSEVKDHKIGKGDLECAICLNEFENDETLRLLPKCDHVFHPQCIDAWLGSHSTCPVCRADLVPHLGDKPVQIPVFNHEGDNNGEVVVQVDEDERPQAPMMNRNLSFDQANRMKKSRSIKMFGFNKYRSHSTGHSLVQPGENIDRFTLRLPAQVRKDVMDRATLNRAKSCIVALPSEESSRKGYRGEEGSNRAGRLYQKIEQWSDRKAKSERRNFLTRGFSTKSTKMGVGINEESTSKVNESRSPKRLPSLKCLEPKALDEESPFSVDQLNKSRVNNV